MTERIMRTYSLKLAYMAQGSLLLPSQTNVVSSHLLKENWGLKWETINCQHLSMHGIRLSWTVIRFHAP